MNMSKIGIENCMIPQPRGEGGGGGALSPHQRATWVNGLVLEHNAPERSFCF